MKVIGESEFLMPVKVTIDDKECTGCGICYNDECPDVFMEGDDGNSNIKQMYQKGGKFVGEVPDSLKNCVKNAEGACAASAIKVE
ncbi:MAG: ferredoxin [Methanomassiliicoccales archaeon]|nr:ferredoxin [Methanomassiliicoccales archaeon]